MPGASVGAASAAVLVGLVSTPACSAKHDPAGGLLLSIDTNLKVPDDIDTIGISVSRATDGGLESEDNLFPLAPDGTAKFPATLTLLRGTGEPLQIVAVGYKDGAAVAMRQAVTTLPADRVALLPLELNWLDKPLVSGTTSESVRSVTSSCGSLEAPVAGTCSSFQLDSASLAAYAPSAVVPSDGPAAVDCDACFTSGQTVTPDPATCTFTPPAGVTDAAALNVAFRLAPGHTAGWCNGGSCIIPLPNDPVEGWSLGKDGLIHLPAAACTSAAVGSIFVVPTTPGCPVVSAAHPPAQVYGSADAGTSSVPDAGLDATPPPPTEAGADSSVDAGPAAPPVFLRHPNVLSIATDPAHVFVLSDAGMALEIFSQTFKASDTAVPIMLSPLQTTGYPESAAAFPYYAVVDSTNAVVVLNTGTPMTSVNVGGISETGTDPTLTDLGTGSFRVAWNGGIGANTLDFANGTLPTPSASSEIDDDSYALGIDTTCPASAPCYIVSGENDESQWYLGTGGGSAGRFQTNLDRGATEFAFPFSGGHFVWSDSTGAIDFWNGTTWGPVEPARTVSTAPRTLAASSGRLFWITPTTSALVTATIDALGNMGPATPVVATADGGVASGVQQVLVQGTSVYWFDGAGIYRQDVSAFP